MYCRVLDGAIGLGWCAAIGGAADGGTFSLAGY